MPELVLEIAGGRSIRPVWRNELGGVTFQLANGAGRQFVKWQPAGVPIDLAGEAARLTWASRFVAVPSVIEHGAHGGESWLVTEGLPGETAVAAAWLRDPRSAVTAIGEGLRAFHDMLPVESCPFQWRPDNGKAAPKAEHDELVVCHRDACAPNTLLEPAGRYCGHVDLGAMGVGDRWADLAIATWSTRWNYGDGWEDTLLDAYGIERDPDRIQLYRDLWGSAPPTREE